MYSLAYVTTVDYNYWPVLLMPLQTCLSR